MTASNFNLRHIAPDVMARLKKEASKKNLSVNSLILQTLEQALGFAQKPKRPTFHDLDHLIGTWSDSEAKAFEKNVKPFEKIDEELWS